VGYLLRHPAPAGPNPDGREPQRPGLELS